ncbi:MAG: ECF transporter S component [Clostridiales bacterium]|nr:ECF transporter S component [Clostridiales bacterium]
MNIRRLTVSAMLAALAIVMMMVVRFPLIPAAPFLEYDMGDVPVLIGTFMFGVPSGLLILLVVSLIQALTVSAASGWVGFVMHFAASGLFLIAAGLIYKKIPSVKGVVLGLVCGSVVMVAAMIPLNLIFTVYFLGTPRQAVTDMLIPAIIPFNALKAIINSVGSFILYIPLKKALKSIKV